MRDVRCRAAARMELSDGVGLGVSTTTRRSDRYRVSLGPILRRFPAQFRVPKSFVQFAAECAKGQRGEIGWFDICYSNPNHLADGDVRAAFVPCLHLPDGALVGFWFRARSPVVCLLDHDGEGAVIAPSWSTFQRLLRRGETGVPDLDGRLADDRPAKERLIRGGPFQTWLREKRRKPENIDASVAERVRRALLADLRKRRALRGRDAIVNLVVTLNSRRFEVHWYAGGLKPYPGKQALRPVLEELRSALGRPLSKSDMSIWADGRVYFEGRTEFAPRRRKRAGAG